MLVGGVVLILGGTFYTIPTVGILPGRSYLFPPET